MLGYIEEDLEPSVQSSVRQHLETCTQCTCCEMKFREAIQVIENEKQAPFDMKMFAAGQKAMSMNSMSMNQQATTGLIRSLSFAAMLVFAVVTGIMIGKEYAFEKSVASDYQTELFYLKGIHMENQVIAPLSEQQVEP